ncbi:DNA topoisomerase VI subunit B [Candidatus Nanohalococcus occultus]|uniref:Type 2 DNA topoisomerase 6 subunit B n=1 Tax=Candidatus Nanohalococcus occultus TaxID=2978047 RepID=A0ABY8CFI7_9ARCH|nr:DNA topoisomerase VI, subunit B [Candidatus Nanohaloarchaeota archaeon SVXNc]
MSEGMEQPEMEESDHKEISVAEFFEKNRHLLGFENPQKSIITVTKEAVDNSLDACEGDEILPEIHVLIDEIGDEKCRIEIRDNAIGLDRETIPKVFGKLLYGSKFHKLQQSRGQQGIGISASAMYAQLTTGEPVTVWSKQEGEPCHKFVVRIDTEKNEPEIIEDEVVGKDSDEFPGGKDYYFDHGTTIEMNIEAKYTGGHHSVKNYLKHTAIMNPYARIVLREPDGNKIEYPRVSKDLPQKPKEIKPHPHGVELGIMMRMIEGSSARTVSSFLQNEFTRVGRTSADDICEEAGIDSDRRPNTLDKDEIETLLKAAQNVKLQSPPKDCLSPIGEELIEKGLQKELNPDMIFAETRKPKVYKGNPFQVEVGLAWGGDIDEEGSFDELRFANKVPLLYKKSSCVTTKAVEEVSWNRYNVSQTGDRPQGPLYILVHIASVWVPFTSEGKEAVANYEDIRKEMKLALQEVGRKLGRELKRQERREIQEKKKRQLTSYAKEMGPAIVELAGEGSPEEIEEKIQAMVHADYNPEQL